MLWTNIGATINVGTSSTSDVPCTACIARVRIVSLGVVANEVGGEGSTTSMAQIAMSVDIVGLHNLLTLPATIL